MTCERPTDSIKCKDPGATLDYKFDWSAWLSDGDTIDTFTLTPPAALSVVSSGKTDDDTSVTVLLSGGVAGAVYDVVCSITTAPGALTDERTMSFVMANR